MTTGTGAVQLLPNRVPMALYGLLNPTAGAQGQAGTPRQKLPAEPQRWASLKTCTLLSSPNCSIHMIKPQKPQAHR